MTTKPTLSVTRGEDETTDEALARVLLTPTFDATVTTNLLLSKQGQSVPLEVLTGELETLTGAAVTGTDTLLLQAATLDKLFHHMTRLALGAKYVSGMAEYLRLAMRAQAQCRATLEAVSNIRNPRQYVGTQHVSEQYHASGHLQVNRDARGATRDNPPNELSVEPER